MKNIKIIILLLLPFSLQGRNYIEGDSLNVFAKSGLNIRVAENILSKKIGLIPFGASVRIINTFNFEKKYCDEIENLKGNWVIIKYKNLKGFVFDGYLSKLKIPDYPIDEGNECSEGIGVINTYIKNKYGLEFYFINYPHSKFTDIYTSGEKSHDYYEVKIKELGKYRYHRYHEGLGAEIIFKNSRDSEVLNLAKILINRCNFQNTNVEIHELNKEQNKVPNYRWKGCCPSLYLYKKNGNISFMINFYL